MALSILHWISSGQMISRVILDSTGKLTMEFILETKDELLQALRPN